MDIRKDEPLITELSLVEVETVIGKLKRYKFRGSDPISAEMIKAGGKILSIKIHKIICCIWITEEFSQQRKESITVPKMGNMTL
jgi:hypothetical protein